MGQMFTYHLADLDLRIEIFLKKDGTAGNEKFYFETRETDKSAQLHWRLKKISYRVCLLLVGCFSKKNLFKSSLDLNFHPLIIKFF